MFYEGRRVKEVSMQKCKKTLVVGEMAWQVFIDCGGKLGFHKLGFNPGVPIRRASLGYGNSRLSFLASEYVLCSTGFLSCTSIQYCSTAANLKSRSWLCGVELWSFFVLLLGLTVLHGLQALVDVTVVLSVQLLLFDYLSPLWYEIWVNKVSWNLFHSHWSHLCSCYLKKMGKKRHGFGGQTC